MQPTIYNIRDRFKELSSYSGMAVAVLAVVLPQLVSVHTLIEILMPCGSVIGALLFFMPENRTVLTAEQVFDVVLKMLPAQYRVAALKDPVIGAVGAEAGSPGVPASVMNAGSVAAMLLLCFVGLGLAGCGKAVPGATAATGASTSAAASAPAATPLATAAQTLQALQGFSAADISNAIGIATKAEATDPYASEVVDCLTWWQTGPAQLAGLLTAPSGTVGAATVFTEGMLGLDSTSNFTSAATQAAYEKACGPLNTHLVNQGLSLATQIAALAGRLGIKIAVPALAVVPGS